MESKMAARNQENHFHHLHEELVLYIFNKVVDVESLCRCSLVSKHFASVIPHVQTICVKLVLADDFDVCKNMLKYTDVDQIPALPELLPLRKLKFLEKFKELESINLEFTYPEEFNTLSFQNWKVKSKSDSPLFESFITLYANSLHKMTEYPKDRIEDFEMSPEFIRASYGRYVEWFCLIRELAKRHAALKCVRISDSEKRGNLVIRDDHIVMMRSPGASKEQESYKDRSVCKSAWVRELRLPLSKYVMKGVTILIIEAPTKACANAKYNDDITYWGFDDEEKVFGEAVNEFLKNHRDKIDILRVSWDFENELKL